MTEEDGHQRDRELECSPRCIALSERVAARPLKTIDEVNTPERGKEERHRTATLISKLRLFRACARVSQSP